MREKKRSIALFRWNDNSVVTVTSNACGVEPNCKTSRLSVSQSTRIKIPQPKVIQQYNRFMGEVDQMDHTVGDYRVIIACKSGGGIFLHSCLR